MVDVLIIGGGAAGLSAAIEIKRRAAHMRVCVLEANDRFGKKIRASGNGKCNIGNTDIDAKRFFSADSEFVKTALHGFDAVRIIRFLERLGIVPVEEEEGKLFPMSKQASFVAETLAFEAERLGVALFPSRRVTRIVRSARAFDVETAQGNLQARRVVLATGSCAAPQLGGSKEGYRFAKELGHRILDPLPSLVQLTCDPHPFKRASGVRLRSEVTLFVSKELAAKKTGDVLFTDYGISGLAVLDLSPYVSLALARNERCELRIDLFPDKTLQQLQTLFERYTSRTSTFPASLWIQRFLPKKLGETLLRRLKMHTLDEKDFHRKRLNTLAYETKHLRIAVNGTRGFKGAEVALGGVDTREIDPITMASKRCKGLYIVGEMLDVTGERGGFNFHFAFTSALRAAKAIAKEAQSNR